METEFFHNYLINLFGPPAKFRDGQIEAIESTIINHFTLVVEKTGWGKSLVYFFATKYFREKGFGPTIIISPLLSLMRNQIENASKLNLKTSMITYETNESGDTEQTFREHTKNKIDILFITPEQLAKQDNQTKLSKYITSELKLFVIDEVHCVSEWGHDFRPDFLEIKNFVNSDLIRNNKIHILTTTATADDFVITDLLKQFKTDINLIRGPLTRESLNIRILKDLNLV